MREKIINELAELSTYLTGRRDAIMRAWREASEADPEQTTALTLSKTQFYDHIPIVLEALEEQLRARPGGIESIVAEEHQKKGDLQHGLHRWQQGYRLREVTREWGHLHLCLLGELEVFVASNPGLQQATISAANRELAKLVNNAITDSTAQYVRMEKHLAESRMQELENALNQLSEMERQRAELMREAVHDLGGNVQAVGYAASLLGISELAEAERKGASQVIKRNLGTLRSMLGDLMSLARLDAGKENRQELEFDAAAVLTDLCADVMPLAAERGLSLDLEGPNPFSVEGDAEKVQRIVQNLVINALKYTDWGGVKVQWGEENTDYWWITVRDTGPGIPSGPVAKDMKLGTDSAHEADEIAQGGGESSSPVLPESGEVKVPTTVKKPGEGIGLSIVKRLCDLLDASLELSTSTEDGTVFRVLLPRRYLP